MSAVNPLSPDQPHPSNSPASAPVPVERVLATIRSALSNVYDERAPAESAIKAWESDAAPGFLVALMRIAEQTTALDEVTWPLLRA